MAMIRGFICPIPWGPATLLGQLASPLSPGTQQSKSAKYHENLKVPPTPPKPYRNKTPQKYAFY